MKRKFKFIGDLSIEDADVIYNLGWHSENILEFGAGGSTQIFSQCNPNILYSVETDPLWIAVTERRLQKVSGTKAVFFEDYRMIPPMNFDLIFVDGVDHLRREFAIEMWSRLNVNGVMIFHDTRRFIDFQNAAWVAQLFHNEISRIDVNAAATNGKSSNMTVIYKKEHEPYVNWNIEEGKPFHAYGDPDYDGDLM